MPQRILVVGPSWVGDMVMAQALFIELKQRHPGVIIDVLAPGWTRPLLERMPEVRRGLELSLGHGEFGWAARRELGRRLADEGYDQAIVLPNSWKSALIPWFARVPVRTGWRGEMRYGLLNDCRVLNKQQLPLMVQRFVALALPARAPLPDALPAPMPVPQLRTDPAGVQAACNALGVEGKGRILALCPGAEFGDSKQWPAAHYAEVASTYLDRGWQVWLFGSENDRAITGEIAALATRGDASSEHSSEGAAQRRQCVDLAGRTSLAQAIDLLSLATAVVSNDSGLMHIAAALHKPLVAVYGSTSPEFTPPLTNQVELLHTDIDCRPCFKRVCPLGHKRCLTELLPERVLSALDRVNAPLLAVTAG